MSDSPNLPPDDPITPDPPDEDAEQRLADAIAEYIDRQAREEPVDLESFCRMRPDLEPLLRRELLALATVDEALGSRVSSSVAGNLSFEDLPEKLSGHRILGVIGSGGMGRVLLGIDDALDRKVAIKTLNRRYLHDEKLRSRFMQEARAMARVNHPHVVNIYHLGPPDEIPHFVMEYVEGVSLTEAARPLNFRQKAELMHKVVAAVQVLHEHQIIHRDLKPGNVLVGADLEPKVLDFGLAQQADDQSTRLTLAGEVMGTPDYFSPEQARADPALDARSDIFSLGTIFYQLLTGVVPFRAEKFTDRIRRICEEDPVLPRRINRSVPGDLQNICLKAMEKNPGDRYGTAGEMADDLARFLSGEEILATPAFYSRLMAGKIDRHLRELEGWRHDQILSVYEYDSFRKLYDRLVEREDAWILEVRRLTATQVTLYLGGWVLAVGATLLVLFRFTDLAGTRAVLLACAATVPAAWLGIRGWNQRQFRISVAYLLSFCLLLPATMLVAMNEWSLFTGLTQGKEDLEFFALFSMFHTETTRVALSPSGEEATETVRRFSGTTNAQLWWAIALSLPVYLWLRRFTRASVFSLVFAVMGALLCLVTLLRMGMLEWLDSDPGRVYFYLIPAALIFFISAVVVERAGGAADSRYFYPIAVLFTFVAMSGVAAFHEPYADWLKAAVPRTRGQLEYLFIFNAAVYLLLQSLSERFGTPQMRSVAKAFRFVIPGHVLASILLLGMAATNRWMENPGQDDLRVEARYFEILLPTVACLFVFGSIPKQMKNFFATGLLFLAIGIIRLQQNLFEERAIWPVTLLIAGLLLMVVAAHYTPLKLFLLRKLRRRR